MCKILNNKLMKKIILSLSVLCFMLLLFSNCSGNDIVEIPDANFKTYLLENFDKNNDGNISLSEAKAVKEINCSGKNIVRLDGIEKFENLESLDCSNNQIFEIEIRHNKKLNKLASKGNDALLMVYIGVSSPLIIEGIQLPKATKANEQPNLGYLDFPLDESKCSVDRESTNVSLVFDK